MKHWTPNTYRASRMYVINDNRAYHESEAVPLAHILITSMESISRENDTSVCRAGESRVRRIVNISVRITAS